MLEEKLKDTRKSLERLALETGQTLQSIIDYLNHTDYSQIGGNQDIHFCLNYQQQLNNIIAERKQKFFSLPHSAKQSEEIRVQSKMQQSNISKNLVQKAILLLEKSIIELNKVSAMMMENMVQQMMSKKIYKIRENFRRLIISLLGIDDLKFYTLYSSGEVQFQDFSSNMTTKIMDLDQNYQILQNIINSTPSQFIFSNLKDNSNIVKLFRAHMDSIIGNKYSCVVVNKGPFYKENNFSLCLMVKSQNKTLYDIQSLFTLKLIYKIIEISQINSTQGRISDISKNYTKKMIDLLVMLLTHCETKLKSNLGNLCKIKKQLHYYNVTYIIKVIFSKIGNHYAHQQNICKLGKLAAKFEETQCKKIEDTRIYKKYIIENQVIMMEFNSNGVLQFISGNNNNKYLTQLTQIWEKGKPVLKEIFSKNQKFNNYIKKAVRGLLKSERPLQIANYVKVKIMTNEKKIEKIQIIIEDSLNQNQQEHFQYLLYAYKKQSTHEGNNGAKYRKYRKLESMKEIQKQGIGVSRDLYVKGKQQKSLQKSRYHVTHQSLQNNSLNFKLKSRRSSVCPKEIKKTDISHISIDDIDLNFLIFADKELQLFAIKILNSLNYYEKIPHQKNKLNNFITQLHKNYETHSNPFHNFKHAINVMHTCYLLSTLQTNANILTEKDVFVIVFSGLCHDVGHTGFTNAFQVASMSRKALTYNKSPLQNYHAFLAFEILQRDCNNFLCHMQRQEFLLFRKFVTEIILFTDMKEHFSILNNFNEMLKNGKVLGRQDIPLLSAMIVHSSDFAGSIKQFQIAKIWSIKINQQFSNQYRVQEQLGLPQTPFMKDLTNPIIFSNSEINFLRVIVYPLYQTLDKFYATEAKTHKLKKNVEDNIKAWDEIIKIENDKNKSISEQPKQ